MPVAAIPVKKCHNAVLIPDPDKPVARWAVNGMAKTATETSSPESGAASAIRIRPAKERHLPHVIELDSRVTGTAKPDYWQDIFERYGRRRPDERFFLIAEPLDDAEKRPVLGYIVGEVRTWEFGSAPCGWVFAFSVDPRSRLQGIGENLFRAMSAAFRDAGIDTMRTMVARENNLHMAFFRSEGMTAGPYIQLEKTLD